MWPQSTNSSWVSYTNFSCSCKNDISWEKNGSQKNNTRKTHAKCCCVITFGYLKMFSRNSEQLPEWFLTLGRQTKKCSWLQNKNLENGKKRKKFVSVFFEVFYRQVDQSAFRFSFKISLRMFQSFLESGWNCFIGWMETDLYGWKVQMVQRKLKSWMIRDIYVHILGFYVNNISMCNSLWASLNNVVWVLAWTSLVE